MERNSARTALFLVMLTMSIAESAFGQTLNRSDYTQVLVPISYTAPRPGALGSIWDTELWVRNTSSTPVIFDQGRPVCHFLCGGGAHPTLDAQSTQRVRDHATDGVQPGILLYVEKARSSDVTFSLHAQDLSRTTTDWGTELPVVREEDFFHRSFEILNVPRQEGYRVALRVYGLTVSTVGSEVRVLVLPLESDEVLLDATVPLRGILMTGDPEFSSHPTFAVVHDLTSRIGSGHDRLRIRIEPLTEGSYWAFASVTHNQTQHVTIVSPQ